MEVLEGGGVSRSNTFFTHVFNMSPESNAEIMNVSQYALLGLIPILALNKIVQRFVPEADSDKSSVEILVEIILQTLIMFVGVILIHRIITYIPPYSGYVYERLTLTNVILAFLIIVLSLQTKLGIKVNILYDRILDLWNGTSPEDRKSNVRNRVRIADSILGHTPSQSDHLDGGGFQAGMFPPAPVVQSKSSSTYDHMMRGAPEQESFGPMPANAALGGSFGRF